MNPTEITRLRVACSNCNLRELCLPVDLTPDEMKRLEELSNQKRSYATGDYLYRSGDRFKSLHAIRSGSFKTRVLHEDGREQVTGFLMAGEIIGLEAISTDVHTCEALAMEDSEVCELPYAKLAELSREIPSLQRHLYKIMSREIVRDQGIMLLLGSMRAEERLAAFLLNLSQRNATHGMSATQLRLRMSRLEIGSYLGLKLETVSRAFSHFQEEGLIQVKARAVDIVALSRLREMVGK
ncbi:MAG: fumarate/nitrate reduction transcriptional regulator Fnr [Sideroxydans sp.]|nr:fumarate/nitrate reduction transcriptional regulator Fnr [Sideroxydans sp.]MDD5471373.1 fumarate/nitrate reduction transcriptional regulator Fnr [Sideroxydans sp.]